MHRDQSKVIWLGVAELNEDEINKNIRSLEVILPSLFVFDLWVWAKITKLFLIVYRPSMLSCLQIVLVVAPPVAHHTCT